MSIQWFPGHMAKAEREMKEKMKVTDIICLLLDARIPFSSSNALLDALPGEKKRIYVLTKTDLADPEITATWIKFYRSKGITVIPIDLMKPVNVSKIEMISRGVLKDKLAREKERGMKDRPLRMMIAGIPNVGKSTFINRLVNKKATMTGNKPGVTKVPQWIGICPRLQLLDTPGILQPKFDNKKTGLHLALTGAIPEKITVKEDLVFYLLSFLRSRYPGLLKERYGIEENGENFDVSRWLRDFTTKYKLKDFERAYDMILNDFKNGRIGRISLERT